DELDLIAQALDERRPQRPVDESAGEDGLGRGSALAAEERTGDLAGGVLALLDVDGEREEVELLFGVLTHRGGGQHHRLVVEIGDGGAGGLTGQTARLETDGAGAELAVVDDGFGGRDLGTLHWYSLLLDPPGGRRPSIEAHGQHCVPEATTEDRTYLTSGVVVRLLSCRVGRSRV